MRILLLNQFFHPDLSATAQLATDLAEDLAAAGHQVTALATSGTYLGGARLPTRERHRGVEIVRVRATSLGKGSIARRLADYGTFYLAAAWRAASLPRPDVVLCLSTPPLVASLGAALRAIRGVPFVYWLQDVYPDLAVEFGVLRRGGLAHGAFRALAGWTERRADRVVVLGEAMGQRAAAHGVAQERIAIVPNWADGRALAPVAAAENRWLREHGLTGRRVVLYSGNMGRAHDMATVLGAARALRHREDLVFAFVGDGARRAEVEAAARALPTVRLLPYVARERLAESLSGGDVHVVTQTNETLGLLEPSKLYGALAVGRPVLYVGPRESEAARTVAEEGVGRVVPPGDVAAAVQALEELIAEPEAGARAREAFLRRHDRPIRTARLGAVLEEAGQSR